MDQRVRVDLDILYGPAPESADPDTTGGLRHRMRHNLRLTGWVPGTLHWWVRSVDGRWLGLCDFTILDVHGAAVIQQRGVAVPASALKPMDEPPRT